MSDNHALDNALNWLQEIEEMVSALNLAREAGDDEAIEEAETRIREAPLSVQVRDGWYSPGEKADTSPDEYEVLLSTGGPALRIIGELDAHAEPDEWPILQWQDWGTQWTPVEVDGSQRKALAVFAGQFYFGDG